MYFSEMLKHNQILLHDDLLELNSVLPSIIARYNIYFLPGRDCVGCAKTGSGKTAAFALPILHRLAEDAYGVFALIITPAR